MLLSPGCLLLLACAAVQCFLTWSTRRVALLAAAAATLLHRAGAARTGLPSADAAFSSRITFGPTA